MKILIIAPRYHTNLHFRVKALIESGNDVFFISQYRGTIERYDFVTPTIIAPSILFNFLNKLVCFKNKKNFYLKFFIPSTRNLKKEIKKIKPDLVIVKGMKNLFSLISLYYSKKFKIKSIFLLQIRRHYADSFSKKFYLFLLKKYFKVIGIISEIKDFYKYDDDFFSYIPFSIEAKDFYKSYFKDNIINIISVGKFVERKRLIDLVKVAHELSGDFNIRLLLVGQRSDKEIYDEIIKYIRENRLSHIVEIKKEIKNEEILKIYESQDLFVLPSYNEPAAYSLLEAMSKKLPIICSDTNGTKCYIDNGKNGLIFKSNDIVDLKNNIVKIISDRDNIISMGNESYKIVKKNFSQKSFLDRFYNFLKERNISSNT